jgi:aldehyde dehydrogenase (NAD+)
LDEAYRGGAKAQHAWAALMPGERAAIMRRAAQIMEARREEIVSWIIHESGGTRIKANLEWNAVHGVLLEAATLPYVVEGRFFRRHGKGAECIVNPWSCGVISPGIGHFNLPPACSTRTAVGRVGRQPVIPR